jgi:hypothetical protein
VTQWRFTNILEKHTLSLSKAKRISLIVLKYVDPPFIFTFRALGLLSYPEGGGSTFLLNAHKHLQDCTESNLKINFLHCRTLPFLCSYSGNQTCPNIVDKFCQKEIGNTPARVV